jgi:hypothetical protein
MIREPLRSSNVSSVGWEAKQEDEDADMGTLEIEFVKGGIYQYQNVPRGVYEQLLGASSPGKFVRSDIIDQFDHERVG